MGDTFYCKSRVGALSSNVLLFVYGWGVQVRTLFKSINLKLVGNNINFKSCHSPFEVKLVKIYTTWQKWTASIP